jgi:hypothetical protein
MIFNITAGTQSDPDDVDSSIYEVPYARSYNIQGYLAEVFPLAMGSHRGEEMNGALV